MRSKLFFVLIVAYCLAGVGLAAGGATSANIQVYFSPRGGCTEAAVDALSKAKSTHLRNVGGASCQISASIVGRVVLKAIRRETRLNNQPLNLLRKVVAVRLICVPSLGSVGILCIPAGTTTPVNKKGSASVAERMPNDAA